VVDFNIVILNYHQTQDHFFFLIIILLVVDFNIIILNYHFSIKIII
jgi:hypothetical protein